VGVRERVWRFMTAPVYWWHYALVLVAAIAGYWFTWLLGY
jgi:hypothetical protein